MIQSSTRHRRRKEMYTKEAFNELMNRCKQFPYYIKDYMHRYSPQTTATDSGADIRAVD